MLKAIILYIFSLSLTTAAAGSASALSPSERIPGPHESLIIERPGIYRVTINNEIINSIKECLAATLREDSSASASASTSEEVGAFTYLMKDLFYTHPREVNIFPLKMKFLRNLLITKRLELGLPVFSASSYARPDECLDAFNHFIETSLPGEENASRRGEIKTAILETVTAAFHKLDDLLEEYSRFYESRQNKIRLHAIETYLNSILSFSTPAPLAERKNMVLSILVSHHFLTILGSITKEHIFIYSPRPMVESYIGTKGFPDKIVLGCTHSSSREMLEELGLPSETWCGDCKDPHDDAMVVSLHESNADVLCDLNHPDLWAPLRDNSVTTIQDETWFLSCYQPTTLAQISRILKRGGEFISTGYTAETTIKDRLSKQGFETIEESAARTFLKMRKTR